MRISGIEPSSGSFKHKMERDVQEEPKQAKAKKDGVRNPQNYNYNHLNTANFDALKTLRINRSRP